MCGIIFEWVLPAYAISLLKAQSNAIEWYYSLLIIMYYYAVEHIIIIVCDACIISLYQYSFLKCDWEQQNDNVSQWNEV